MVGIILWHLLIGLVGSILIMILINRLKQAYYRLQQQTIMDALTGIPNRRYFTERVLMEFRRSRRDKKPLSLIICDIDYFKTYNDHYGHQGGDECLSKVAKTIQAQLHRPGDICARYGGEEFVIILPNTPLSGVLMKAEQIRSAVENLKIEHAQSKVNRYVTISLGAATELQDTFKDHEALIKEADDALYRAKAEGRNRVCTISNVIENTTEPVADV
jgi:diguanylate cyclase (GGDEF)-like protein